MRERPPTFRINRNSPLAKGLVFAALGGGAGTLKCVDASGYNNHGTLTNMDPPNNWTWVSELGRWSLDLDGGDDYVLCGTTVSAAPVTIATWFNQTADGGSDDIVSINDSAGNENSFRLNAGMATAGDPLRAITLVNGSVARIATVGTISLNTWTHGAAVFASATSRIAYLNGVAGTENTSSGTPTEIDQMTIGAGWASGAIANMFPGMVADVMVWNRALSASEIQMLADPSNVMLSGLIENPRRKFWAAVLSSSTIRRSWQQRRHRRMTGAA